MFTVASLSIFTIFCVTAVFSVTVRIDGVIDLGPNWNYEYKLESVKPYTAKLKHTPVSHEHVNLVSVKKARKKKTSSSTLGAEAHYPIWTARASKWRTKDSKLLSTNSIWRATEPSDEHLKLKGLYEEPHRVKDDTAINDFTYHVYKQSLKVFDQIKSKLDPTLAFRVDMLAKSYDEKFRDFINETLKQKIKTRLGPQRVILNTMDTSNRLLKKLINYFIGDITKEGLLRSKSIAVNVFQKEVDRECDLEIMHVCTKFGICRTSHTFSDFLIDFFTIIIKNDDSKVKMALDALTEVAKNTNFNKVMKSRTRGKFLNVIEKMESWDGPKAKAMFWIGKNIIALKNQPISVMTAGGVHVNKTVALLEVIDELDKKLPANDENMLEWSDLKNSLNDWTKGNRYDILEIMQGLVSHFKKKGIDKMDDLTAASLNNKFNIIFSY